jgi:hypothetical protein
MQRGAGLRVQAFCGVIAFLLFFRWGWLGQREPFHTYFYLFAWWPFLWTIDRTLAARTGDSLFYHPMNLAGLLVLSTSVWLIFEALNFRLQNWVYTGLPHQGWTRWLDYALSFATVVPGILMVRELIESFIPPRPSLLSSRQEEGREARGEGRKTISLGAGMLLLPMLWPCLFFPLVWIGFFFLLDPWVGHHSGHSLLSDWRQRQFHRTWTLLASGLICGLFWEGCNYGAGAKWHYTLPHWRFFKIFEMPALGFIGFLPFALEVHAFHQAALLVWRRTTATQHRMYLAATLVFWAVTFYGIDRWTVIGWK